jgi:hypothetical protein
MILLSLETLFSDRHLLDKCTSGKPLVLSASSSPTATQFVKLAELLYQKIEKLNSET